ncbi:MAG: trypsin-like peptidase domain-containing protein, partial [Planctomycetaceae bacterium]
MNHLGVALVVWALFALPSWKDMCRVVQAQSTPAAPQVAGQTQAPVGENSVQQEQPKSKAPATERKQDTNRFDSVETLAAAVRKSIVEVRFLGRNGDPVGLGTGFVVAAEGIIATNLHVIGEARPIQIRFANGEVQDVQVVHASDPTMDLALLKIDVQGLPALELGNSDDLKQGQQVVAIGNPKGLQHSVVSGVVSGRRELDGKPMLQLAIPIEEGNSGGPVLDMNGRVHGIVTLKSIVTPNLGYAVAINALKHLIDRPNPVPMTRWLTVGTLDPKQWTIVGNADWKQRAGRVRVSGQGAGFGGRSLCLSSRKTLTAAFEIAVDVKLGDESGAAGLVFHADGGDKHYGFYPTGGQLRLTRFDGPTVFSWNVLSTVRSRHYRPGEWNVLRVRLTAGRIACFVNDQLVIESTDGLYGKGRFGLAKFRDTHAEFKRFRSG